MIDGSTVKCGATASPLISYQKFTIVLVLSCPQSRTNRSYKQSPNLDFFAEIGAKSPFLARWAVRDSNL